jgi:outer membrane protein OmpA-like peptidoglycan-associated protein
VGTKSPEEELRRLLLSTELDLLDELDRRTAGLAERVGDDAVLQESLRRVIVDVLRDAGADDHERLSTILAPLMLSSLRAEIRGSRDMMVEALYPLTGRLVSAAVKNAFRDMLQNLDTKLTETFSLAHLRVRMEALFTGKSAAEVMLSRNPMFTIKEVLVISRTTGLLVCRVGPEGEDEEEVDRDLVGSMLNAVMSLTRDAFGDEESGELSTMQFGDSQLFVKSSPTVVLVVSTTGTPPASLDALLEALFVAFLEGWGELLSEYDGELDIEQEVGLVTDLRARMESLKSEAHATPERGSVGRSTGLLAFVGLLLIAWMGFAWTQGRRIDRLESDVRELVDAQVALAGYPIEVYFDRSADVLVVSGLTPNAEARESLRGLIDAEVDGEVRYLLNPLLHPSPEPDPIETLEEFVHQNPIYFSEGQTLRAPVQAEETLRTLAGLLLSTPDNVRLRVIGYADPLGSVAVNEQLTRARARVAVERLVALGVSETRLSTVGRPGERQLTDRVGQGSDSRRTEFEVYFTER